MNTEKCLTIFAAAAQQLDKKQLAKKQLEVATGTIMDAVFLKLYKKAWASSQENPLTATSRIFFSVWLSDKAIQQQKLLYNIHALKLRQLKGYTIQSRQFAAAFREQFKPFEKHWQNISTDFGPLTLMEGWLPLDWTTIEDDIARLAKQFLFIDQLIDHTLEKFV